MVTVVGAVGIDMIAMRERFLEGTSNPSDIRMGLGGVGYRIFSNLETPRRFVTALGADPISRWARETLEADGDAVIQEIGSRQARPPLYLALMESGNLKVAASDFRIIEQALSPDFVTRAVGEPGPNDFLVLDANLSPHLVQALVDRYAGATRVVFEPVSVEKAHRHLAALRGLSLFTPTEEERDALVTGDASAFLRERGIGAMLVTRGEKGTCLYTPEGSRAFAPHTVIAARDTTGAGDLLVASLLSRLHEGRTLPDAVEAAMRAVERRLGEGAA
jgi:sugar/nucleoside kinase (ribokinase family)